MKPIGELAADFRKRGAFVLVNTQSRKLCFFHYSKDMTGIKQMMDALRGRQGEMVDFLIAQACIRGVRPK